MEKCALEKLGNLIVAETIDAEGANYVERFSRQMAIGKAEAAMGLQKADGTKRSPRTWKEPQEFVSGRIPAAEAGKIGCQKWHPAKFCQNAKREVRA